MKSLDEWTAEYVMYPGGTVPLRELLRRAMWDAFDEAAKAAHLASVVGEATGMSPQRLIIHRAKELLGARPTVSPPA